MPVIIQTGSGEIGVAVQAMRAGAVNFIEKPYEKATLLDAIVEAYAWSNGEKEVTSADARLRVSSLSGRERDVLDGLIAGQQNADISDNLHITLRDVEIHRANMMEKLRVRSLSQALHFVFAADKAN